MIILAIDTATPAVTAGVVRRTGDAVEVLAEKVTVDARAHAEQLTPNVVAALAEAQMSAADLDAVVAGCGPGPFTGLRVGMASAAAFGHALGVPVYGVCSLDAIGGGTAGGVLVVTDARRREVYWAAYQDGQRVSGPAVDRPADLDLGGVEHAVGDGALRYAEVLGVPVRVEPRYPSARALAELAAERVRGRAPGEPLTPLYLRRPDAVEPGARKPALR